MTLKTKIVAGVTIAGLISTMFASAVFADNTIEDNGAGSVNTIRVRTSTDCTVYQSNKTAVHTEVVAVSATGGNNASFNTGGGVDVTTGDATTTVGVIVGGGSNEATDPCCGCDGQLNHDSSGNTIAGNGALSHNKIKVSETSSKSLKQKNKTWVGTSVLAVSKTGKNKAKYNTGPGDVTIDTGAGTTTVDVIVDPSANTLNP